MIEPTPWMIGGGARHSAKLGRALARMALGNTEGVAEPGHLAVRATASPSMQLRVDKGVFAILNTYGSEFGQTYIGFAASETLSPSFATTGGSARSDMLIARIDDPEYGGTVPTDPVTGEYVKLEIISNVGSSAVDVPGSVLYPAIPLARVDLPASTSAITQAMVTDLRKMPSPQTKAETLYHTPSSQVQLTATAAAGQKWPNATGWSVEVPAWATHVHFKGNLGGLVASANAVGSIWGQFGENGSANAQQTPVVGYNSSGSTERWGVVFGSKLAIPAALRGTTVNVSIRGKKASSGTGTPYADANSSALVELTFVEEPVVE